MGGAKGLENLKSISKLISPRSEVDIHCSYHLHLGNISKSRNYLCALYILGFQIQDELFKMFPYYKTEPQGIKKKNYCQKLKRLSIYPLKNESQEFYNSYIEDCYTKIFTFLSDGISPLEFAGRKKFKHPIAQKWSRPSRYVHLNLQNMIFSERGTAEFRIHQGSLNTQKLINWLFICNAIVSYAEVNEKKILTTDKKITFEEILNHYKNHFKGNNTAEFLSKYLIAYYKERCAYFEKDFKNNDYASELEAIKDKEYSFTFEGVTNLF